MNSKSRSISSEKKTPSANALQTELSIEKLSFGGDGIARKDGLVYFVPLSAPGDRLLVNTTETKKNFVRAQISEILQSSPERAIPKCPYYQKCGGCNWQHIDYPNQIKWKELILREQLKKLNLPEASFLPIIPSKNQWNYRNRIQVQVREKNVGYYGRRTHEFVPISECLIAEKEINEVIKSFSQTKGLLSNDVQRAEIYFNLNNEIKVRDTSEAGEDIGFSQVNRDQNLNLIELVISFLAQHQFESVFDLYGGAGNFAFPINKAFPKAKVFSVELNQASVLMGREMAKSARIPTRALSFFLSDVGAFLRRVEITPNTFVVLDPPRSGCDPEVVENLRNSIAAGIVYVSCNPSSLARDLEWLTSEGPYAIKSVQPIDMFPQTDHIESIVYLVPKIDMVP